MPAFSFKVVDQIPAHLLASGLNASWQLLPDFAAECVLFPHDLVGVLLEKAQNQHNYMVTSKLGRKAKPHSTGHVAFARCVFWQLHQIDVFSHLCVKSISLLILG